jgi:membrane-associated protease RseP (regulator of RpoE activity)
VSTDPRYAPGGSPVPPLTPEVEWPGAPPGREAHAYAWRARPRPRPQRVWLHALLFVLTLATTILAGAGHYGAFLSDFGVRQIPATLGLLANGLWYSLTILAILGAHEMGHYLACRYYRVDATLPYFIPAPLLTGTFGAVIRIREPILSKRALFDIGIAGPIAGFLVAVPALFLGLLLSNTAPLPAHFSGLELGEPLLFRWGAQLVWGTPPAGETLNLHPMAFAAWFGFLATALNLFPIAQLDGGHISYAVFGRRSTTISYVMLAVAMILISVSLSWLFWTLMIVVMLFLAGARHPPVLDEDVPLDRGRVWLAVFALVMFILCFTPAPIEPLELIGR